MVFGLAPACAVPHEVPPALQVEEALTSEVRERAPVGVLKKQLVNLQAEVAAAHERLHTTQVQSQE